MPSGNFQYGGFIQRTQGSNLLLTDGKQTIYSGKSALRLTRASSYITMSPGPGGGSSYYIPTKGKETAEFHLIDPGLRCMPIGGLHNWIFFDDGFTWLLVGAWNTRLTASSSWSITGGSSYDSEYEYSSPLAEIKLGT